MTLLVAKAAVLYGNGDFSAALAIYRQLSETLGPHLFRANIRLCEKRLCASSLDECRDDTKKKTNSRKAHEKILDPSAGPNLSTNLSNNVLLDLRNQLIPGGREPIWHVFQVEERWEINIYGEVNYEKDVIANEQKAILLIQCVDINQQDIDKPCGKLAKSRQFNKYYKYLNSTDNELKNLHRFIVPDGVAEIKIGFYKPDRGDINVVFVRDFYVSSAIKNYNASLFYPPSEICKEISILGWPDHPPNTKPYVIGVMDEFTSGCFERDVNLIQPRPDNWFALAEKYSPEFFFIESAWKGNHGSWQYRVGDYSNKPGREISHICQYARQKGIPTVFWNKEDPVHHDKFMCTAELVDYIFTTDEDMIGSYRSRTGNQHVHTLPFAAQPSLHRPRSIDGRITRSCFAGSWYGDRHQGRGRAMQWLLGAANEYGLDIYDRNYGTGLFPFPNEYNKGIKGKLPYKQLCEEYGRYRIFLNVNSVSDSPTMFSRRVFELLACGTPVVSTYARGIEDILGTDAIWMVHSEAEARVAIQTLMFDDEEWRRRSLLGIRKVFSEHTYLHRLKKILETLKSNIHLTTDPEVLLISSVRSLDDLQVINLFAKNQTYQSFTISVECLFNEADRMVDLSPRVNLLKPGEIDSLLNQNQTGAQLAGRIAASPAYGNDYLRDLVNASIYEPSAGGWAKSIQGDRFAYGYTTDMSAAIWSIEIFVKEFNLIKSSDRLVDSRVFIADSDQFSSDKLLRE